MTSTPVPRAAATVLGSQSAALAMLRGVDAILLDLDGVLWAGHSVFPGVPEALHYLRHDLKKHLFFVSNNATVSRAQMLQKFHRNGLKEIEPGQLYTSAYAAAVYLNGLLSKKSGPSVAGTSKPEHAPGSVANVGRFHRNLFVLGNPGLCTELQAALAPGRKIYGLEFAGTAAEARDAAKHAQPNFVSAVPGLDPRNYNTEPYAKLMKVAGPDGKSPVQRFDIGAVVIAQDYSFSLPKLAAATMCLQDPRCLFVATNDDPQFPVADALLPGAGALVAALAVATGRKPDAVCGKPSTLMLQLLLEKERLDPGRCLMVGDRLTTDVDFGLRGGCQTLFVLSGCEELADVEKTGIVPHYVADGLVGLHQLCLGRAATEAKPPLSKL